MAPRGGHAVAANSGSEDDDEEAGFSRSYFLAKEKEPSSGKKRARAAGKLSDLNLVDEQVLRASLAEIPPKHEKELEALTRSYKDQYRNWLFELRCGFSLLMYGFGSKKLLLEDFASATLTDFSVVVVNGYLPSINLKQLREKNWTCTLSRFKTHTYFATFSGWKCKNSRHLYHEH